MCGRRFDGVPEWEIKALFEKAPDIIHEAAQSPLGVASLSILVLGVLVFLLFRGAAEKLRLFALATITASLLGFVALVFVFASNPTPAFVPPPNIPPPPGPGLPRPGMTSPLVESPEKTALGNQATRKLADADRLYIAGQNDQARAAYGEPLILYKQEDHRLGQANVNFGLGALDSRKNPKKAARCFFEAAQLFDMIGMTEQHDAALREADKLYKK